MSRQEVRLSRVVVGIKDGTHGTFERVAEHGLPLLSAKNVRRDFLEIGEGESLISYEDHRSIVANGFPRKGDILLTIVGTIGRSLVFRGPRPMAFQRSVCFVRPSPRIIAGFLNYAFQSDRFQDQLRLRSKTSAQPGVYMGDVVDCPVPLPPLAEQRQVIDFLDRETAQIDELIGKQERLVALLGEKRQAIVSDYVADMVQPTAEDSGIRLKNLYEVIDERAKGADLPLMSVSIHRGLQRRDETTDDEPRADDLSNYKVCRPGDLVINRMRAFQGALGCSAESGLISPDYIVLRPHRISDSAWLATVLRSHWAVGQMRSRLRGIGSVDQGVIRTPRINASDLGEIRIRVPTIAAQLSFVEDYGDLAERIDLLANKAASAIDLLNERRTAVVSAAVLGKSDVCFIGARS